MKFLRLKTTDPYYNLAVEEYLFRHTDEDVFMLWQNAPCVVIGKNQNAYAEINMDVARAKNIKIVRRITGGGAVYHDLGNLNYTFISAKNRETVLDFAYFCTPIIDALASLGVTAELSGRNDLTVGGKKISGNAQHSADGKTLHHGTLLFDTDAEILSSVLHVDEEKLRAKSIRSVRSRVTNVKTVAPHIDCVETFAEQIARHVLEKHGATPTALPVSDEIDALRERNASSAWIFPNRELLSRYSLLKKKRYPFGSVEIALEMENDVIRDVCIRGDFFAMRPIEELEETLRGKPLSETEAALSSVDTDAYICGMDAPTLIAQIRSE